MSGWAHHIQPLGAPDTPILCPAPHPVNTCPTFLQHCFDTSVAASAPPETRRPALGRGARGAQAIRTCVRQADLGEGRRSDGLTTPEHQEPTAGEPAALEERETPKSSGLFLRGRPTWAISAFVKVNQAEHRLATMCRTLALQQRPLRVAAARCVVRGAEDEVVGAEASAHAPAANGTIPVQLRRGVAFFDDDAAYRDWLARSRDGYDRGGDLEHRFRMWHSPATQSPVGTSTGPGLRGLPWPSLCPCTS